MSPTAMTPLTSPLETAAIASSMSAMPSVVRPE
jgi:hypothetical protein